MGGGHLAGIDVFVGPANTAALSSRPTHPARRLPDQPPPRGHGRAVVEQRLVTDDEGSAVAVAGDDLEAGLGLTSEQGGDSSTVVGPPGCGR